MKNLVLFFLLITGGLDLYSQNVSDSIEIRISYGVQFRQHGKTLSPRKMLAIMKVDNTAYNEMLIAKSKHDLSLLFGIPGGFLIGWPIGTMVAGGVPNWRLAAAGVALTIISIKCTLSYTRHARIAAGYFNEGLRLEEGAKTSVNFGLCDYGLGLTVRF
jgi:hypothetical protein